MDIKEKIEEKRQKLSYKVQSKIKEYLRIQGMGRRTDGMTTELTFRVMDVITMSLWDEIVPLIESETKELNHRITVLEDSLLDCKKNMEQAVEEE